MSRSRLWGYLAIALPVLAALLASLQSVDLAYHLRVGAMILDSGRIPATDTFTFTVAGEPWRDQQWGAEVLLALVFRAFGWTGLVVLRAALVGAIFALVFDACRRSTTWRTAALLTLVAFGLAAVTLALRPQLFAMGLFALTIWLVTRRADRPSWLWLVVPIAAVWANVHGSFFLAPLSLGLAAIDDALDPGTRRTAGRTLVVASTAAAATLANPFGLDVWSYAVGIATNPLVTERISEWQPTTPLSFEGLAFYASVLAVAVLVVARTRRSGRVDAGAVVWLAPFAAIGVRAVRGLAWWPLVAAPTVARLLDAPQTRRADRPEPPLLRRLNAVVAAAVALVCVALLPAWRPIEPGLEAPAGVVATAPPGITEALRDVATSEDRLFAPQPWASWFEFAVPEASVFVDSRIELFPAETWDDYEAIDAGDESSLELLESWEVTIVVTAAARGRTPLDDRLAAAGWRETYRDADGAVWIRPDRPA